MCQRKYGEEMLQSMSISNASYYWQDPIYLKHNIIISVDTHSYYYTDKHTNNEKKRIHSQRLLSLLHYYQHTYIKTYSHSHTYTHIYWVVSNSCSKLFCLEPKKIFSTFFLSFLLHQKYLLVLSCLNTNCAFFVQSTFCLFFFYLVKLHHLFC